MRRRNYGMAPLLLQCLFSSPGLMVAMSCSSVGVCPLWLLFHSALLASFRRCTSSWFHAKMQEESLAQKMPRVVFCSEAAVKASHKMEAVQAHCRFPWMKQLSH
ncbi:unnamed protein product [Arctogadus glacialis]